MMEAKDVITAADAEAARNGNDLGWLMPVMDRYRQLTSEDQRSVFWNVEIDALPGVSAALLFLLAWNTERFWELRPAEARSRLHVFHMFHGVVFQEDARLVPLVRLFMEACPYLVEINDSDENWTDFQLPGEK
jgi:hypothetical protein